MDLNAHGITISEQAFRETVFPRSISALKDNKKTVFGLGIHFILQFTDLFQDLFCFFLNLTFVEAIVTRRVVFQQKFH
jgi:hypothetical protein